MPLTWAQESLRKQWSVKRSTDYRMRNTFESHDVLFSNIRTLFATVSSDQIFSNEFGGLVISPTGVKSTAAEGDRS